MMLHSLAALLLAAPAPNDLVLEAPSGPLLVRLHIEIDGKPLEEAFHAAQRDYLRALFSYLDRDKNGYLDEAEARRAPLPVVGFADLSGPDVHIAYNFKAMDLDGDGKVSFEELASYYREFEDASFAVLAAPAALASRPDLFSLLDTNGDGKLSREEIAAAGKVLAALDRDADELLRPAEAGAPQPGQGATRRRFIAPQSPVSPLLVNHPQLKELSGRQPDLELRVRLGQRAPRSALLEIVRTSGKIVSQDLEKGEAILLLGRARVELRCDRSWLTPTAIKLLSQRYRRDVRPMDADYLERVLSLQAEAMARRVSVLASQPGEGLWDLLDRNRDGVLGVREMRDAPKLLASLERDKLGELTPDIIPPSFVIQIGPGRAHFNRISGGEVVTLSPRGALDYPGADAGGGPLWFRKMDRNGDGDVSPAEFLGSPEEFKKLDLDDDGLISREEAERAVDRRKD